MKDGGAAPATASLSPFAEPVKPAAEDFRVLVNQLNGPLPTRRGSRARRIPGQRRRPDRLQNLAQFPDRSARRQRALEGTEKLKGPQAVGDQNSYRVWHRPDPSGGAPQRFLVNDQGQATYLVDPGINGTHKVRPDGSAVQKFDAPKATLMSYIIKGILSRELPWGLVLLGVMIAIVLEMSGIPSLAFAVGVYLPLSSSSPIFIGGLIRWLVDRWLRREKFQHKNLTPEELTAEGDKSSGVLLASGYIAGGALAGIVIAIMQGVPALAFYSTTRRRMVDGEQSIFPRPKRKPSRAAPIHGALRPALSRRPRRVVGREGKTRGQLTQFLERHPPGRPKLLRHSGRRRSRLRAAPANPADL